MRDIGLRIVIGHESGSCPNPGTSINDFTVMDTSGIHVLPLSFCQCLGHPHVRIQLLRTGWLPASLERPRSAFTFDCLEMFQLLNQQGKLSAHDYCKTLAQISDATSLKHFPVCYIFYCVDINPNAPYYHRTDTINSFHAYAYGGT